ncbi:MAG: TrbI/VirB10 family protein [Cupriavidus necator]
MVGTVIPAALITGINSDLPGQVIASVTEGVHDTATGKHLLIPQGSRLIGRYDSQVAFGHPQPAVPGSSTPNRAASATRSRCLVGGPKRATQNHRVEVHSTGCGSEARAALRS